MISLERWIQNKGDLEVPDINQETARLSSGPNPPGRENCITRFAQPDVAFITITTGSPYHGVNPAIQYDNILKPFRRYCNRYDIQFWLVPELTKIGNIHFHGIVQCSDNLRKQLYGWVKRKFGYYSKVLYPIQHPEHCYEYCMKDGLYMNVLYQIATNMVLYEGN